MLDPSACLEGTLPTGTLLMGKLLMPCFAPVALSFWAFDPTSAKSLDADLFTFRIFNFFYLLTFKYF